MFFMYKVKTLTNKNGDKIQMIELYDFVLGEVKRLIFDDSKFMGIEQQLKDHLKDIRFYYGLQQIT